MSAANGLTELLGLIKPFEKFDAKVLIVIRRFPLSPVLYRSQPTKFRAVAPFPHPNLPDDR